MDGESGCTAAALRALYGAPSELSLKKQLAYLDAHSRRLIALQRPRDEICSEQQPRFNGKDGQQCRPKAVGDHLHEGRKAGCLEAFDAPLAQEFRQRGTGARDFQVSGPISSESRLRGGSEKPVNWSDEAC